MFELFVGLIFPCSLIAVAWWYYNKGLNKSGHVCVKPKLIAPIMAGSRYTPVNIKLVTVNCLECGEEVNCGFTVVRTISDRTKGKPYRVDLHYDDYNAHLLTHSDKKKISNDG